MVSGAVVGLTNFYVFFFGAYKWPKSEWKSKQTDNQTEKQKTTTNYIFPK